MIVDLGSSLGTDSQGRSTPVRVRSEMTGVGENTFQKKRGTMGGMEKRQKRKRESLMTDKAKDAVTRTLRQPEKK